jgi:hypothetical protein
MKLLLTLLVGVSVYAGDLLFLSKDITTQNLEILSLKYAQTLVVDDYGIYLIPSECNSERYFGGASEGILNLVKGPLRTESVLNTQEVFEAKEEKQIEKKIELDKAFAIVEGKISKDFLEDKEGRGFGGASEVPLVIQNTTLPDVIKTSEKAEVKQIQRPNCQMLNDGSGYTVGMLKNGRLYTNGKLITIVHDTVLFQ